MSFGELYICRFPFTSGAVSKARPVLVLFDAASDVVVCRVTSAHRSGPLDIPLVDWQAAGLLKPSVVRLDRIATIEQSLLQKRIGRLSTPDEQAIRTVWNRRMKL